MSDTIDIEPLEDEPHTAALARVETGGALVRPAADLESIVQAFVGYQQIRDRLLNAKDYQSIAGKQFPKKSAWRKLSVAFGVDLDIKSEYETRDETGCIIRAKVVATATAPNGRHADGIGVCDAYERCCALGCKKKGSHTHCPTATGGDCPGRTHFSNAEHDIPATAETRAKNRAASDLFGFGEVSAEEMNQQDDWWGGWDTEDEFNAALSPLVKMRGGLTPEARAKADEWLQAHYGYDRWVVAKSDFQEFKSLVNGLAAHDGRPFDEPEPKYEGEGEWSDGR